MHIVRKIRREEKICPKVTLRNPDTVVVFLRQLSCNKTMLLVKNKKQFNKNKLKKFR